MKKEVHNGCTFWHHYGKRDYDGLITFGEKKVTINGKLNVVLMIPKFPTQHQLGKFPKQLQLGILSPKSNGFKVETRNASPWNVTEININIDEIDGIIKALQQFKNILNPPGDLTQWQIIK